MIPNDYFVSRPPLPHDTTKINVNTEFTYPITNDETAREFYKQVVKKYKIIFLIPIHIITTNLTNKPLLSKRTTITIKYSLTFPIISRQQLIDTTKIL